MPMWQVWGNWPDRSPGAPGSESSLVTPPSESGRPGCARGRPPPALDPRPEAQRGSVPAGLAFGRSMWLALAGRVVGEGVLCVHVGNTS